jgi:catechol 2,3-dioxygenase-like lactoylglutathione lyase family enzyme
MSLTLHLSLPVADLDAAERFYTDVLQARVGRKRDGWLDIWLFGAQVTLHHAPEALLPVNGQGHRHFGAVLSAADSVSRSLCRGERKFRASDSNGQSRHDRRAKQIHDRRPERQSYRVQDLSQRSGGA